MAIEDPNELDAVDRAIRANELKQRLDAVNCDLSEDCPPEVADEFIDYVETYENAPWTTHAEQLAKSGVELPAPDTLSDEQLSAILWEVIEGLAKIRVFLEQTDHLGDRELYTDLWSNILRDEVKELPISPHGAWHIDMLGSGSEEDVILWLKYYADEDDRRCWGEDWPELEILAHEDPPYDRDQYLPRP